MKSALALLHYFFSLSIWTSFTSKTALRDVKGSLMVVELVNGLTVLSFEGPVLNSASS